MTFSEANVCSRAVYNPFYCQFNTFDLFYVQRLGEAEVKVSQKEVWGSRGGKHSRASEKGATENCLDLQAQHQAHCGGGNLQGKGQPKLLYVSI